MFRPSRFTAWLSLLAVTLGARAVSASITAQAQPIVDRYVEATGGRAALDAERGLRAKGRLNTLSLKGSFEHWVMAPDRVMERITLGSMRMQRGFDGTNGWRVDLTSKQATILSGNELDKLSGVAYFATESWARADQGGGKVLQGPSAFRDGEDYVSLEVTPPRGSARKLWFSAKTGLLSRIVVMEDNSDSDSWFTDYRTIAGRKRAGTESAFDPNMRLTLDPHDDADSEQAFTDSVWVNPVFDTTRFSPPAAAAETRTAWAKTKGTAVLPFRYGGSLVWVRGSINGGPTADFVIDTGASMSVIDRLYAEQIGLSSEGTAGVQGMGGAGAVSFAELRSIRLGGVSDAVTLRDLKVAVTDLAETGDPVVWRHMCGLIGYDILSRFVVEVDYDRRLVTLRDPETFAYTGKGKPVNMTLASGVPVVRVKLDDQCEGDFLVDVGNSVGVLLHGSLVRKCQLFDAVKGHKQLEIYSGGVGAMFMSWVTRIDKLTIGDYEVSKPVVGMSLGTRGMIGSNDFAGNIGSNLLEKFVCTFDYKRLRLYLEPGKEFAAPGHFSRSGSMFLRYPHKVIVASILHGSAAEEAGLKLQDEIVQVDEKPVMSLSSEDIDRLFIDAEPGTQRTLMIVRDGRPKTVKMTLRDAL